ncbi:MAG: multicopper oxidase family protein [Desulfobacterales bacterium]
MAIDRREFLKAAAGVALGACLPAGFLPKAANAVAKPVREFHFSASPSKVSLGSGPEFVAWTYNGRVPGPEIRVKAGDIVRVVLRNYLPEETTIHWHGIPLQNAMDGVPGITQSPVRPGESFVYEFEAAVPGSFLYHSHARYQLDQGLYGPLIVEPARPEETYDREYTLVLEDWVMRDGGGKARTERRPPSGMMSGMMGRGRSRGPEPGPLWEPVYDGYAVNGRIYPATESLAVTKGERVKLRLINASAATIYHLRLAGHALTITHADGNPIRPVATDVLRIGMGERYDVVFAANNPGHWLLAAADTGLGEDRLRAPILYKGVNSNAAVPPQFYQGLRQASYADFAARYADENSAAGPDRTYNQVLGGGMHSAFWTINGRTYPAAETLAVEPGERVRLAYGNRSMMPHPMHLHGHFFRVVNRSLPRDQWVLKDTIIVDPMQRIEVEFTADNPGRWFHHCHNLYHMEAGMANVVAYREPARPEKF